MRYLFVLFLAMQGFSLGAAEEQSPYSVVRDHNDTLDLQSLIEPPLPLSQEIPITLSQANRRNYLKNPQRIDEEAKANATFLKGKSIPWLPVISGLAVFLVIAAIRLLPSSGKEEETDLQTKAKIHDEIKNEFHNMTLKMPVDDLERAAYITHLDYLLRRYLINEYELPAFSYTTQELISKTGTLNDIPEPIKQGMIKTFEKSDRIKFAKYTPTASDTQDLMEMAKDFINL